MGTDKGLVVPVLRDCDQLSFAEIEKSIVDYAKKARSGGITLQDMQGVVSQLQMVEYMDPFCLPQF